MKKTATIISLVLLASACGRTPKITSVQNVPAPTTVTLGQMYSSTVDSYSYEYPTGYSIFESNDFGTLEPVKAGATGSVVAKTGSTDVVFLAGEVSNLSTLTQSSLETYVKSDYQKPDDYTITPMQVAGVNGFKLSNDTPGDGVLSDFYYVQNTGDKILELSVLKNNDVATAIFKSFSFWLGYSYRNFMFRYPPGFTVDFANKDSSQEYITVNNPDLWIEILYYGVNSSGDNSDITKYIKGLMVDDQYTHYDLDTSVAGQKAVHISGFGSDQSYDYDDYHFLNNGIYYRLDFSYHSNKVADEQVRDQFVKYFQLVSN